MANYKLQALCTVVTVRTFFVLSSLHLHMALLLAVMVMTAAFESPASITENSSCRPHVTLAVSKTRTPLNGESKAISTESASRPCLHLNSTNTGAPYCGTVTFFDGIEDYYCDSLSYSTPQQLYTTYDGEDDGRTFTPVVLTLTDDSSTTTTRPNPSPTTEASSTDDDEDATATSSATLSNQTSNNDNKAGAKSSSTNVGAIAGGVVGGVAGLALIGVAIFFIIRHNKKKKAAAAAAATQPAVSQTPQGPMPPVAGAGYQQPPQDPHYSQQYPQQPQYSPQQGYYPDQSKPGGFTSVAPTLVPDRNNSTSPVSQFTDGRQSYQPTSPTSTLNSNWQQNQAAGYPPQQPNVPPTVHEAGGNAVGERDYNSNHHGQFHELG